MAHTYRSLLLHFDKVRTTLVVEYPWTSAVELRYVQFLLQVTLHLAQLQSPDTVCTVNRELLLIICAVGLLGSQRFTNGFEMSHTHSVNSKSKITRLGESQQYIFNSKTVLIF